MRTRYDELRDALEGFLKDTERVYSRNISLEQELNKAVTLLAGYRMAVEEHCSREQRAKIYESVK